MAHLLGALFASRSTMMRPCSGNTFCPLSLSGVASGNTRMYAEYKITGCIPLSSDGEKPVVCSYSASVFPKNYLTNTTFFNDFTKFAVCVLIPTIFVSPISKDDVSAGSSNFSPGLFQRFYPSVLSIGLARQRLRAQWEYMPVVQCGKCKTARYCSLDWQNKDWEKLEQMCKRMQQYAVGDNAA